MIISAAMDEMEKLLNFTICMMAGKFSNGLAREITPTDSGFPRLLEMKTTVLLRCCKGLHISFDLVNSNCPKNNFLYRSYVTNCLS